MFDSILTSQVTSTEASLCYMSGIPISQLLANQAFQAFLYFASRASWYVLVFSSNASGYFLAVVLGRNGADAKNSHEQI
jgi:ABC-type molybdate transport system permease subunit